MNCDDVLDRLHRYAARTLPVAELARVEDHLARCEVCRAESVRLLPVLAGAAVLPRAIDPPRDLWPGIAGRIADRKMVVADFGGRRAPHWLRYAVQAAAAVALVIGTAAVTLVVSRSADRPVAARSAVSQDFAALEAPYQSASEEIMATLQEARRQLSPTTVVVLERNLRVIDEAIRESRDALARDPANAALREMLLRGHRQKLDLLRQVATGLTQL